MKYCILHNRKTGGTALRHAIDLNDDKTNQNRIKVFDHSVTFPSFCKNHEDAKAIFFIRNPITRFLSGFYSRLREGKPRYQIPWSPEEKRIFTQFETPQKLAEAISSWNIIQRKKACSAMKLLPHIRHTYVDFFGGLDFLKKNSWKIAFIGCQETLNSDFENYIKTMLDLSQSIQLPRDSITAHRNPSESDYALSKSAEKNLRQWYKDDFRIYEWCLDKRNEILQRLDQNK